MLCTYLVYNTVVRLCQFFCCGRKANLIRSFLLNPNFLLVHKNRYSEGMEDGQTHRQTDRQTDRQRNELILGGLGNQKKLVPQGPVVLLFQFFVLAGNRFWFYILLMMYLEYNTVVVLC